MALEDIPERPGRLQQRIFRVMMSRNQRRTVGYDQSLERRQKPTMGLAHSPVGQKQQTVKRYSGSRIFYQKIFLMRES